MKHTVKRVVAAAAAMLLALAFWGGAALAADTASGSCGPDVHWQYDQEWSLLRITCTGGGDVTSGTLYGAAEWDSYASGIRTVWISGDVTSITAGAFSNCTALECVVLDTPRLAASRVKNSAFSDCKALKWVYYVNAGSANLELAKRIGNKDTVRESLSDTAELCAVRAGSCVHGTIVTDAAPYVRRNSLIRVSAIPDRGYRCTELRGGVPLSGHLRRIDQDVEITGVCTQYKALMKDGAFGSCGDRTAWQLFEDGELLISGAGPIAEMTKAAKYPWAEMSEYITRVTVDGGVTNVPGHAFSCPALTDAVLGEDVSSIGDNAFSASDRLCLVEFLGDRPDSLGRRPFPSNVPGSFLAVYHDAHRASWASGLTDSERTAYPTSCAELSIENYTLLSVGEDGLSRNAQGVVFTLDQATKTAMVGTNEPGNGNNSGYIGNLNGYVVVPDVVIQDGQTYSVTYISAGAFTDNLLLRSILLGGHVRDVAEGAFYGCLNFTDFVEIPAYSDSFVAVDGVLYDRLMNVLCVVPAAKEFANYPVPSTVRRIWTGAFHNCWRIREVTIASGVQVIGDVAFENAAGIRRIEVQRDLEEIGDYAFRGCTGLEVLKLCDGVQKLGSTPLSGCTALRQLYLPFVGSTPSSGSALQALFGGQRNVAVQTLWVYGGTLANNAFANLTTLREVCLGASIDTIPNRCFDGCTALSRLGLGREPETAGVALVGGQITSIGDYAFAGCAGISRFAVDSWNTRYAADYWGALYTKSYKSLLCFPPASEYQYYCLQSTTANVSPYAFYMCGNLRTVHIPSLTTTVTLNNTYAWPEAMKLCVHSNSAVEQSLGTTKVWIVERNTAQSIQVQHLPDRLAFESGGDPTKDLTGLHLYYVAAYPGVTLLLDESDYTLALSGNQAGQQVVTATYKQRGAGGEKLTTGFWIHLFQKQADHQVLEYGLESSLNVAARLGGQAAFYGFGGEVLQTPETALINNVPNCNTLRCAVYAPAYLLDGSAASLKLQIADGAVPLAEKTVAAWLYPPSELEWNSAVVRGDDGAAVWKVGRVGAFSWKGAGETDERFEFKLYRRGSGRAGDTLVYSYFRSNAQGDPWYDCNEFLLNAADYGPGTYYFTVQHCCNCGLHAPSALARSADFVYRTPDAALPACADPSWSTTPWSTLPDAGKPLWTQEQHRLFWPEPQVPEAVGGYMVKLYYSRWAGETPQQLMVFTWFFDEGKRGVQDTFLQQEYLENAFALNEYRAGYYAFTVTALSRDITAAAHAPESALSNAYYYPGQ